MRNPMMDDENPLHAAAHASTDSAARAAERAVDARIIKILETAPAVEVPPGFTARVAARLPAQRPASLTPTRYGQNAMVMSLVVLLLALLAWAPRSAGHSAIWLALEWILCAQFVSLACWLGARRGDRR